MVIVEYLLFDGVLFMNFGKFHPILPEPVFSSFLYIGNSVHGLDCLHV